MITLCIFLAFPLNMANALEEKTDALEEKADALEEPLDALEEQTEDIQEIETEKKDEEDEIIDSSAPEQENITEISEENPEYHRGDVEVINRMIKNGSIINWEYNNPESWTSRGVMFYHTEHEQGEGRRIERITSSRAIESDLIGSIDLRELEYLRSLAVTQQPITALNISGLKHLTSVTVTNCQHMTEIDITNIHAVVANISNNSNVTSFSAEGVTFDMPVRVGSMPNIKQFTNVGGETLTIEGNGPGEVIFESFDFNTEQFTLRANPNRLASGSFQSGFSYWMATPNGVDFVYPSQNFHETVTFTMRAGGDTTMTAWFEVAPIVGTPVIDKDSITTTGASFSGTIQLFTSRPPMGIIYEYRKKGEIQWVRQDHAVQLEPGDGNPLTIRTYTGSFENTGSIFPVPPVILQPATTYELRIRATNEYLAEGISDIVEFTTLCIVTIRHVESKSDGSYASLFEETIDIRSGTKISIDAGDYQDLIGLHYKLMKNDDSGDIEDTTYALGTELEIVDNTTIIVYHASTVVDVTFPTKMEFYAHYSDGGSVKSKEEYSFVNNSALPVMVNLKRYDVIKEDGINFVANAENDGDMHFSLLPTTTTINNNGFTTPITNIQPNTPLNRSLGTLGGYALGDNSVGGFTIGGKYVGVFYVQPRRPTLQFVFSFEIDG